MYSDEINYLCKSEPNNLPQEKYSAREKDQSFWQRVRTIGKRKKIKIN